MGRNKTKFIIAYVHVTISRTDLTKDKREIEDCF